VARTLPLHPKLISRTAIKSHVPGLNGPSESDVIHETDHQYASGRIFLNDGRDEATQFCEIEIHIYSLLPFLAKTKSPPIFAAGLLMSGYKSESGQATPRTNHQMMMMGRLGEGH
jgi:hypothetical protein